MDVTGIALVPPIGAKENPIATPELLAACLARYSRSTKGIKGILADVDPTDPDKSVEKIFRFVDYGHSSISGLTGSIPIAIDGVTMFMAYKLFEFAQQADGQESSTRYIKMAPDNLPDPESLGIPKALCGLWLEVMTSALSVYDEMHKELEAKIQANPSIIAEEAGCDEKVRERLRRNFALDRVRYVLPWALKTNIALVMSARAWCEVIRHVEALKLPESEELATLIRTELGKFVPRLVKHSFADASDIAQTAAVLSYARKKVVADGIPIVNLADRVELNVENSNPQFWETPSSFEDAFTGKANRYSRLGVTLRRVMVRFGWNNIALAELRDLNRHRTGYRFSPLVAKGFYLPQSVNHSRVEELLKKYQQLVDALAREGGEGVFLYGYLLGTQVTFEHSTQADKLIYEIELRTGAGAHFRYAEHLRAVADALFKIIPEIRPYVEIGTAEPDWDSLK